MIYKRFAIAILLFAPLLVLVADYYRQQSGGPQNQQQPQPMTTAKAFATPTMMQTHVAPSGQTDAALPPFDPTAPIPGAAQPMIELGGADPAVATPAPQGVGVASPGMPNQTFTRSPPPPPPPPAP